MHRVFVYGTLKVGEPNHHWLTKSENGSAKFLANGATVEKYPLIIATKYNIPFLLYKPGVGKIIKGEIYEVDEKMLQNLDVLEEHPTFYERNLYDIENVLENRTVSCWVYFLQKFNDDLFMRHELYDEYRNLGAHGLRYCERYLRDPTYDHHNAVL